LAAYNLQTKPEILQCFFHRGIQEHGSATLPLPIQGKCFKNARE
jgi:hypothetical protein